MCGGGGTTVAVAEMVPLLLSERIRNFVGTCVCLMWMLLVNHVNTSYSWTANKAQST
jgi:hypothetical protein